jgi:hypothetical protein
MVPHCEEGTRRIYYISYVREHAILFFSYKIERKKARKKKTVAHQEQMIELAHMHFIDRKKKRE